MKKSAVMMQTVSSDCLTGFRNAMLKRHNELRVLHRAPALVRNKTVEISAQNWANTLAETNNFVHSGTPKLGENMASYKNTGLTPTMATCTGEKNKPYFAPRLVT